jgi:SAM-dependent methyltransferase
MQDFAMKVSDQIRGVYEQRPYPFGDERALKPRPPRLPLEWINGIGRANGRKAPPERILIAGCGDGTEAFTMSRQFPRSEIVAVDFSPNSIAIAKKLQGGARRWQRIRFLTADLAKPQLAEAVGGEFDLVSCHGVFSYIPAYRVVLGNFARCLKPDGVLYLGVNGASHVSEKLRRSLPAFGFEMTELDDGRRLRDVLKLCDAALDLDGAPRMAEQSPAYLASDVFGALILNLPLAEWARRCREAGLYLRATRSSVRALRRIADKGLQSVLIPRSRAEVCEFLELLAPTPFHGLLFSKRPEMNPPWEEHDKLLEWKAALTGLYAITLPKPGPVRDRLRSFKVKSTSLNTRIEFRMPDWEIEILRRADRAQSLRTVLEGIPLAVPAKDLREQLYLLYQLGVINLLPRGTKAAE